METITRRLNNRATKVKILLGSSGTRGGSVTQDHQYLQQIWHLNDADNDGDDVDDDHDNNEDEENDVDHDDEGDGDVEAAHISPLIFFPELLE
ncbi:hypothetical protein PoB_000157000 [Plakobranchus ocellatus]|uniref:Uncharacterized protein n=1 Tax=Plakobranchus ocellatus TaxID=259542 RepID=A0AAV3XW81_9GAST|nr:hypothetical protein PoB_000157000 [Plakobranchus ocellatus]